MRTGRPGTRWVAAAILCLALAKAGHTQDINGIYVGVGAGLYNFDQEDEELGPPISDSSGIYKIVAGYQLNSNYAVEAAFAQNDDIKEQFFAVTGTGDLVTLNFEVESEVKTLRVLAFAPFSGLSMFGSIGYYDADFTKNFCFDQMTTRLLPGPCEESDSGVTVAGGIQYEWSRIALRGEYEWFDTDDIEASAINVIAVFRF